MKRSVLIVLVGLFLYSCTEVIFENPQPMNAKSLTSIPNELQGKFSFLVLNEETLMEIGKNFITDDKSKAYLSDSLVINKIGNRYVINKLISQGEDKAGKWNVYVLEDKGCGFVKATTFVINSDTYVEPFNASYNGTLIGQGQEKAIIVNPQANQFDNLLKDDSVTVSIILERVN